MPNAVKDDASSGVITYNGLTFNPFRHYTSPGKMVYDTSDRTVKYVQYTLTVETIIHADTVSNEETAMSGLQDTLSVAGAELAISGIGFDTISTNGSPNNGQKDLVWGAKPRVLEMKPIGGYLAWYVKWECEFNISRNLHDFTGVGSGANNKLVFLEFNFEAAYQIDDGGFTTRAISGQVQIPQFGGSRIPGITADWARDTLTIQIPNGFKRQQQQWRENYAKNILEFSVVDDELRVDPFPVGIKDMKLEFDVSHIGQGTGKVSYELSGHIEVAPGYPKQLAAIKFFQIATDKLTRLQRNGGAGQNKQNLTMPTGFRIRHTLGTRITNFSVHFYNVTCLTDILLQGGIWEPLPDSSYGAWAGSMTNTPQGKNLWGNRGSAGLKVNPNDAVVIDLGNATSQVTIGRDTVQQPQKPIGSNSGNPLSCGNVPPGASWIDYEVTVAIKRTEQTTHYTLAQAWKIVADAASSFTDTKIAIGPNPPSSGPDGQPYKPNPVSVDGSHEQLALLQFRAIRLLHDPVPPTLMSVGGQKATRIDSRFITKPYADFFGTPAKYGAGWALYRLTDGYVSGVKTKKDITVCSQPDNDTTQ